MSRITFNGRSASFFCTACSSGRGAVDGGSVEYAPYTCFVMCMPTPLHTPNAPGSLRSTSTIVAIECVR